MKLSTIRPSSAYRVFACPGSAQKEQWVHDTLGKPKASVYAQEGINAHALAEKVIDSQRHKECITFVSLEDITDGLIPYFDYVNAKLKEGYKILGVESLSIITPLNMRGTSDLVMHKQDEKNNDLLIIDLKYGQGVKVSAINNPQLAIYAYGEVHKRGYADVSTRITMSIVQPRLQHISESTIIFYELDQLINAQYKPKVTLATSKEPTLVTGAHCQFCDYKPHCEALQEDTLKVARKAFSSNQQTVELSNAEIDELLDKKLAIVNFYKSLEETAFNRLKLDSDSLSSVKLVFKKAKRMWKFSGITLEKQLKKLKLLKKQYTTTDIKSVAKLTKEFKDKDFSNLIAESTNELTIALSSDKRKQQTFLKIEDHSEAA